MLNDTAGQQTVCHTANVTAGLQTACHTANITAGLQTACHTANVTAGLQTACHTANVSRVLKFPGWTNFRSFKLLNVTDLWNTVLNSKRRMDGRKEQKEEYRFGMFRCLHYVFRSLCDMFRCLH
jgi:hypothetical protein